MGGQFNARIEQLEREEASGGGGSALPPYTSADKGKFLGLGEGEESETIIVVPEQTVTFNDGIGYPTNCDSTGFVVGATGVISVNGTQYNATCADVGNALAFSSQETEIIVGYANNSVIVAGGGILEQATVSLTASVPAVEPKWETQEPVCILKVISPYAQDDNYIDFMVNKSVSELTACFAVNSFKPAFVFLPTITSEVPNFIYDDRTSCAFIGSMPTETAKPLGNIRNWSIRIETPDGEPTPIIVLRYSTTN